MSHTPARYKLEDLLQLMERLRDPATGCPWDRAQNFQSIAPYTLEEAYEVLDAIESDDMEHLCDELGDLLFQVVYHAQMAAEKQAFDFDQVIDGLVQKLLRRHPHIFPDGTLHSQPGAMDGISPADVHKNWGRIKQQEQNERRKRRQEHGFKSRLSHVPSALPALKTAQKLQKKAADYGFDWPDIAPVFAKIREELDEVEEAASQGDHKHIGSEIGDLLFACVNLARHYELDAESALRQGNIKFRRRFSHIEDAVQKRGLEMEDCSLEQLDMFWNEAKEKGL